MPITKEREEAYLKSLGINPADAETPGGFLTTLCKIRERTEPVNPVEEYVVAHDGVVDQWFIPPEHFISLNKGELYGSDLIASIAFGYRYGGVELVGDSFMFEQVLNGEPLTELPRDWIDKLPGWTVEYPITYIRPDETKEEMSQFLSRRWIKGKDCLVLSMFLPTRDDTMKIEVVEIIDAGNGFVSFGPVYGELTEGVHRFLTAGLFMCSLIPHYPAPHVYTKSKKKKTVTNYHIQPRSKPVVVSTLKEQENYLREYGTSTEGLRVSSRKAHMRRAHWQSFWTGPRDSERKKILKWIPPTFVRGFVAV